jgi:hypothetical protein
MDFLKQAQEAAGKYTGGQNQQGQQQGQQQSSQSSFMQGGQQSSNQGSSSGGGFLGSLGDKFNSAAGGGRESEKNEDYLDKYALSPTNSVTLRLTSSIRGVDFVQEKFLGQGPQDNESAVEQAKDEQISDFIRGKYKGMTGSDIPIKDKPTKFDM